MITLLHLYPRELGINGDVGNITALRKRAEWRKTPVQVIDHEVGAPLPSHVDLVHIGSGPVSAQQLVMDDLAQIAPILRSWADDGVPFLAIAGGWQLLGRTLTLLDGSVVAGAGVYPTDAVLTSERTVGEFWRDDVAGFVNYGSVITADGVPVTDAVARFGASIGTMLHGPFLPMNPRFADELLEVAAARSHAVLADPDARIAEVDDRAARSRAAIRARL